MKSPYREVSFRVEENQYRVGPAGLIHVHSARGEIDRSKIHHATKETGVVFGITQVLVKEGADYTSPPLAENWQYHTVSSIEEKWPKVLPSNWLHDLINS